ncbi:unnamed protein product, partial [Adineta steineri]
MNQHFSQSYNIVISTSHKLKYQFVVIPIEKYEFIT